MTRNIPLASVAVCCPLLFALIGCADIRIGSELSPSDPDYPEENLFATHLVEIQGTISEDLEVGLVAHYAATENEGCRYSPDRATQIIAGATFPVNLDFPLEVSRNGEKYSTEFVVDRFQPGRCGWQFSRVTAHVSKADLVSIPASIISDHLSVSDENWSTNSQDTAVVLRCRFSKLVDLPEGRRSSACREEIQEHGDKIRHLLTPSSERVEVSFIDLEPNQ